MGATTTFGALGTYVHLSTRHAEELGAAQRLTEAVLAEVDRTCSRFRSDSDLTRVNAAAGQWVEVDPLLVAAVAVAYDAAAVTDGLVNPLLGRNLVQLGYDRDFDRLVPRRHLVAVPDNPPDLDAWRGIGMDGDTLRIPSGTALDLGSTGKAWASDLVAATLAGELAGSAIVSLGGDIAVAAPDGEAWPVAVTERPGDPDPALVELRDGGLATSSTQVRRWASAGVRRHHLLDPRTGLPAAEVWTTVTATGPTAVAANTASTAAIVLGDAAPDWLEAHDVTARLVAADGSVRRTRLWPADAGPHLEGGAA